MKVYYCCCFVENEVAIFYPDSLGIPPMIHVKELHFMMNVSAHEGETDSAESKPWRVRCGGLESNVKFDQ